MMVKVAINRNYKGKPKEYEDFDWYKFNTGFENVTLSAFALSREIKQGHAYTSWHNGIRKRSNFLTGQVVATDHDTEDERSSFDFLKQDEFIAKYAFMLHSTPSHTQDKPRSRVVYILDQEIQNVESYETLLRALLDKFGDADPTGKDACRFFFAPLQGNVEVLGNVLPVRVCAEVLVKPYMEKVAKRKQARKDMICELSRDSNIDGIINKIRQDILAAPDGEKHRTLIRSSFTMGGLVGAGYIDMESAKEILLSTILSRNLKSDALARKTVQDGLVSGQNSPLVLDDAFFKNEYAELGYVM